MLVWFAVCVALLLSFFAVAVAGVAVLIVIQMRRTEAALAALVSSIAATQAKMNDTNEARLLKLEQQATNLTDIVGTQRLLNDQQTSLNNAFIQRINHYDSVLGLSPQAPSQKLQ